MNDMEILRRGYEQEHDSRNRRPPHQRCWTHYAIGASRDDMKRLLDEGFIVIALKNSQQTMYKLSEKGDKFVWAQTMEHEFTKVPAADVKSAMDLVVGFEDIKDAIAKAVESRRRTNFLLEGPPACAKSIMLEGVRSAVPGAYIAFGSRTSASGLSEALFEHQPQVLLLDEADKMHSDVYSVLLGLMESGEILETKSRKTRGIKLNTMLIAACNSTAKMPPEFLSRFALHVFFPAYSREEFLAVCQGFLSKAEHCPKQIAAQIGQCVYDYGLGDVRKARAVWQLMTESTQEEIHRVIQLMLKYNPEGRRRAKSTQESRMPGL